MDDAGRTPSGALVAFTKAIAYTVLVGLIAITVATLVDVVLRAFFNKPLYGLNDLIVLAIPLVIAGCFPAGLAMKSNIAIRFLGKSLGPGAERWLEVFGHLMMALFMAVVTWQSGAYASELGTRETPLLQWPVQPSWWGATVLIALATLVELVNLGQAVVVARAPRAISVLATPPPAACARGATARELDSWTRG